MWSTQAWEAALPFYNAILRHPFITGLADGTLPQESFLHYIRQDSLYLREYSRVLAHIASRLPDIADADTFMQFALDGVATEKALHASFTSLPADGMSPACLFYTSLLKAQAYENVAVEAAAVLPCFWIYRHVGQHIIAVARKEGNPYGRWIETYADPAFAEATRRAIGICDRLADSASPALRQQMTEIYLTCSRLEWMFWDSAYNQQSCFEI